MADRGQMHPRLYQYRRKFSLRVYLIATVFAIITIAQWGTLLFIDEIKDILVEHYYISIITLLAALVMVTLFVFFEGLRFAMPLNWLVSLLTVELVTVGLARIVIVTTIENCGYSLAVVGIVTILFILLGVFLRRDLTLDVVIVFVCAIVFFVGSVFFAAIAIVADISYSIMLYCGFVIATVLLFLMYHAQTISGGRYAEMRLNDYLLAALIIYHDFIILYILSLFISTAIAGENKLFNIYHGDSCSWCNTTTTSTTTGAPLAANSARAAGGEVVASALIRGSSRRKSMSRPPIKRAPETKPLPPSIIISIPPPTEPIPKLTKPIDTTPTPPPLTEPTQSSPIKPVPPPPSAEPTPSSTQHPLPQTEPTLPPTEPTPPKVDRSDELGRRLSSLLPKIGQPQSFEEYQRKYDLTKMEHI